ncbi:hypothetical protein [Paraflavitalea speifideaquila]|uniref:hypothetical protein n=1 Tax=Paraflavitalea speifideaquila TaxID=3076558 RepID=UPI0028E277FB|nr:hypothetical protein [Paraflavitalea speifideiaquila]
MWGLAWLPADINAANFGVVIKASLTAGVASVGLTASVDHVTITVYYQNAILLPLVVEQFAVTTKTGTPTVTWTVTAYEGLAKFLVERSADARTWEVIKVLPNLTSKREYNYVDLNPLPVDSYYRIAVENEEGSQVYSSIKKYPHRVMHSIYTPTLQQVSFIFAASGIRPVL